MKKVPITEPRGSKSLHNIIIRCEGKKDIKDVITRISKILGCNEKKAIDSIIENGDFFIMIFFNGKKWSWIESLFFEESCGRKIISVSNFLKETENT